MLGRTYTALELRELFARKKAEVAEQHRRVIAGTHSNQPAVVEVEFTPVMVMLGEPGSTNMPSLLRRQAG